MKSKLTIFMSVLVVLGMALTPVGTAVAQDGSETNEQNCSIYSQAFSSDQSSSQAIPAECLRLYERQINRANAGTGNPKNIQPFIIGTLQDPSFEAFDINTGNNPYWLEYSFNFGTPLCTIAFCTSSGSTGGTAGPRTGSVWAWFGGVSGDESASLSQSITIPVEARSLAFYLWVGAAAAGSDANDIFWAEIDGVPLFIADATDTSLYPSYSLIWVNISQFADGNMHTLSFASVTTGQLVTFNVDDVFLSEDTFADVPSSHPYYNDINTLYANGYTGGCSTVPLMFCPNTIMDRAQAAVFLLRGNFGSGYVPVTPSHLFADNWSNALWAEGWAESMYLEGLTGGCSLSFLMFCPYDQLTNVQVAVFGLRMKYGTNYAPPAASGTLFADLTDVNFWGTPWAEQAYVDGLIPSCGTSGGKPLFCPDNLVSRGFGASVIVKAKNLVP